MGTARAPEPERGVRQSGTMRVYFLMATLVTLVFSVPIPHSETQVNFSPNSTETLVVKMPLSDVPRANEYRCATQKLVEDVGILSFIALPSDYAKVHHMSLYFCPAAMTDQPGGCPAGLSDRCKLFGGFEHMGANVATKSRPISFGPGTGVNVGPSTENKYAVLQVHNNAPLVGDESGFELHYTHARLPRQVEQAFVSCGTAETPIPAGKAAFRVACSHTW